MTARNITFPDLRNWWPILTAAIIVTIFAYSIKTDVALIKENQAQQKEAQLEINRKLQAFIDKSDANNKEVADEVNDLNTRVTVLEKSNKISLLPKPSAGPTPTPTYAVVIESTNSSSEINQSQEASQSPQANKPEPTPLITKVVDAVTETVEEILPL